jgi:hypothetical protein
MLLSTGGNCPTGFRQAFLDLAQFILEGIPFSLKLMYSFGLERDLTLNISLHSGFTLRWLDGTLLAIVTLATAEISQTDTPASSLLVDTETLLDILGFGPIEHDSYAITSVRDEDGLFNRLGNDEVLLYEIIFDVQNPQDGVVPRVWFMACGIQRLIVDNRNLTPVHIVLTQDV